MRWEGVRIEKSGKLSYGGKKLGETLIESPPGEEVLRTMDSGREWG